MFLDLDKKNREKVAVVDDSKALMTYGEICDYAKEFKSTYQSERLLLFLRKTV